MTKRPRLAGLGPPPVSAQATSNLTLVVTADELLRLARLLKLEAIPSVSWEYEAEAIRESFQIYATWSAASEAASTNNTTKEWCDALATACADLLVGLGHSAPGGDPADDQIERSISARVNLSVGRPAAADRDFRAADRAFQLLRGKDFANDLRALAMLAEESGKTWALEVHRGGSSTDELLQRLCDRLLGSYIAAFGLDAAGIINDDTCRRPVTLARRPAALARWFRLMMVAAGMKAARSNVPEDISAPLVSLGRWAAGRRLGSRMRFYDGLKDQINLARQRVIETSAPVAEHKAPVKMPPLRLVE